MEKRFPVNPIRQIGVRNERDVRVATLETCNIVVQHEIDELGADAGCRLMEKVAKRRHQKLGEEFAGGNSEGAGGLFRVERGGRGEQGFESLEFVAQWLSETGGIVSRHQTVPLSDKQWVAQGMTQTG